MKIGEFECLNVDNYFWEKQVIDNLTDMGIPTRNLRNLCALRLVKLHPEVRTFLKSWIDGEPPHRYYLWIEDMPKYRCSIVHVYVDDLDDGDPLPPEAEIVLRMEGFID